MTSINDNAYSSSSVYLDCQAFFWTYMHICEKILQSLNTNTLFQASEFVAFLLWETAAGPGCQPMFLLRTSANKVVTASPPNVCVYLLVLLMIYAGMFDKQ